MAKRNQTVCTFGGHDAGQTGGAEHITFHRVAGKYEIERLRPHDHAPFGHGDPFSSTFVTDIDHVGLTASIQMREPGACRSLVREVVRPCARSRHCPRTWSRLSHGFRFGPQSFGALPFFSRLRLHSPRHHRYSATAWRVSRARSARVAAATSLCRIKLSPIRNVETPIRWKRARSAGALKPLSATTTRSRGIFGARRSLTASDVSKVRRSRLFIPIRRERSFKARSSSTSS